VPPFSTVAFVAVPPAEITLLPPDRTSTPWNIDHIHCSNHFIACWLWW